MSLFARARPATRLLTFHPEPIADMIARYPAAVATVVDASLVALKRQPPPGDDPTHIFDFPTGLRLIVSVERYPDDVVGLHLSASAFGGLLMEITAGEISPLVFLARAVEAWQTLSGSPACPQLVGFSEKGIPHWLLVRKD